MAEPFDLLIVGGGINGTAIARDAAGRGLRVLLCERGDLGEGTSSRSSKLIHGGLRYLEHYEFRLVREALIEREVLLRLAPHIVRPMRFVLPHGPGQRPAWLIRAGLLFYDHLGARRRLAASHRIDLRESVEGEPLDERFHVAFVYADCWTDDARLVVLNALDAAGRGATVKVRTEVTAAHREPNGWRVALHGADGVAAEVRARVLVNAAGPWVDRVQAAALGSEASPRARLVKGSHLVIGKFWRGEHAYILQNDDRRVVFVIPYEQCFALIGTTDVDFDGAPQDAAIDDAERDYLLRALNRHFRRPLSAADVLGSYSGVRALYDDGTAAPSEVTRDYVLKVDTGAECVPLLAVYGGKITTHRRLAEQALDRLRPYLPPHGGRWTATCPLPGGDLPGGELGAYARDLRARCPWLEPELADHYARLYGTRADQLLDGAGSAADLGRHFGGLLYGREAEFLIRSEWALTPADILQRRTKHGLHLSDQEQAAFSAWMVTR
jgi:glycerol-3-phosphate dehydrogenase